MITLKCKSCGEPNQVESFISASHQNCSSCGMPLMGGGLAMPGPRRSGDPKPWEQMENAPAQVTAGTRNITIKAVATINFFYGGLYLLCALMAWMSSSMVSERSLARNPQTKHVRLDEMKTAINIVAITFVVLGMPMIVAGLGLLARMAWGRYLALGLAGLSAALTVYILIAATIAKARPDVCSLIMTASYSGLTFFVLLQPHVAAEFSSSRPE